MFDDSTFNSVKFISLVILSKMSNLDFQIKIIFWQEIIFLIIYANLFVRKLIWLMTASFPP